MEDGGGMGRGGRPHAVVSACTPPHPQDFVEVCKREGSDPEKGVDRLLGLGSSRCGAGEVVLGDPRNREGAIPRGSALSAAQVEAVMGRLNSSLL